MKRASFVKSQSRKFVKSHALKNCIKLQHTLTQRTLCIVMVYMPC